MLHPRQIASLQMCGSAIEEFLTVYFSRSDSKYFWLSTPPWGRTPYERHQKTRKSTMSFTLFQDDWLKVVDGFVLCSWKEITALYIRS